MAFLKTVKKWEEILKCELGKEVVDKRYNIC